LTLRFIGEVEGHVSDEIHDVLGQIEAPCFSLELRGVGHFPPRGEPRALWVGIEKNERLMLLHNRIESALVRIGLPSERRRFAPHVTVARLKGSPVRAVASFLARNGLFRIDPILVDAFHLYSSKLTAKHAVHRCEATYALMGASPEEEIACSRPAWQR
jgi:2'-5' RNA ligase